MAHDLEVKALTGKLLAAGRWVAAHAIVPLHESGVFEAAAYAACWVLEAQYASFNDPTSTPASMGALVATLLVLPCWAYSWALHYPETKPRRVHAVLLAFLFASMAIPLALLHASRIIGVQAHYVCTLSHTLARHLARRGAPSWRRDWAESQNHLV